MIKLEDHKVALTNLGTTIDALDNLDALIAEYSVNLPGPAYCTFHHSSCETTQVQFDRNHILLALQMQRQSVVDYLAKLGIVA